MALAMKSGVVSAPTARSARAKPVSRKVALRVNATATLDPPVKAAPVNTVSAASVMEEESKYILQTYGRSPLVFTHGKGCKLYDANGKEYIDMAAGIAVNALGHTDERWYNTMVAQAGKLTHTSNLYHTVPQVDLARRLVQNSFADKVFFCNSGTEANEGAIKFSRKYARVHAGIDPYDAHAVAPSEILSFTNSFHGRTMGALALTYKQKYKTPFAPSMPGTALAKYNHLESAARMIKKGVTCAVFVEPVQGEGGCTPAEQEFLAGLRKLCDEAGALLVFDEVQCGLGRTGKLWGYELFGVLPDIMTLAKPLAGGLPIGAVLMTQKVADVMKPGDHGSTFAGNPLVCAAACTVFDVIADPLFLADVCAKGERLRAKLTETMGRSPLFVEARGKGLLTGVQLTVQAGPLVNAAMAEGVLSITAGKGDVLRLVPPLVVTNEEIDAAAEVFGRCLQQME